MKFVCFGYLNEKEWEKLPEKEQAQILHGYLSFYQLLREKGHFLGGEGLKSADAGCLISLDGANIRQMPLSPDRSQIGGYFTLEAKNLQEAVSLISQHPGLKLGVFEIRPVDEELSRMVGAK